MAMMVDVGVGHVLEGQMLEPFERGLDIRFACSNALKELGEV
jgi:hypothetical protein